jgi:uncharacterized protein (TIGR00251 family)
MAAHLFRPVAAGLAVSLRVTPNADRAYVDGVIADADGAEFLKVAVTATPEDGKANAAVIKLLAKEWHLAKTSLTIASGAKDRRKTLLIEGDPCALETKLADWLKARCAA